MSKEEKPRPTRQRIRQVALRAAGLCEICGKPAASNRVLCVTHLEKQRKYARERMRKMGCKPWVPGGPGRPPLSADEIKPTPSHVLELARLAAIALNKGGT